MVEGKSYNVELLSGASFIYTRDSHTLELLKKNGVKAPIMEFAPDGCFGNDIRDEEKAFAFLQKHDLRERQFITVMLRTNTPKHPGRAPGTKLDSDGLGGTPTPEMAAQDEQRAAVYREVMTQWIGGWRGVTRGCSRQGRPEHPYRRKWHSVTNPWEWKKGQGHMVRLDNCTNVSIGEIARLRAHHGQHRLKRVVSQNVRVLDEALTHESLRVFLGCWIMLPASDELAFIS